MDPACRLRVEGGEEEGRRRGGGGEEEGRRRGGGGEEEGRRRGGGGGGKGGGGRTPKPCTFRSFGLGALENPNRDRTPSLGLIGRIGLIELIGLRAYRT